MAKIRLGYQIPIQSLWLFRNKAAKRKNFSKLLYNDLPLGYIEYQGYFQYCYFPWYSSHLFSMIETSMQESEARRVLHHEADVVIVGAGIIGCAIAATMGRQGRSVLLLEKSLKEPDRIVGELLQPGGVSALKKLGLQGGAPIFLKSTSQYLLLTGFKFQIA